MNISPLISKSSGYGALSFKGMAFMVLTFGEMSSPCVPSPRVTAE